MQPNQFSPQPNQPPAPQSPYGTDTVPMQRPAGFWLRLVAAIIDGCILGVVTLPIGFLAGIFGALSDSEAIWINLGLRLVSLVAGFIYTALFFKYRGATPGKLLFGLRVVDSDTGLYIGWGKTLLREYIGKFVGTVLLFSGFIMVGVRKDKRGLHDLVANTRVIRIG